PRAAGNIGPDIQPDALIDVRDPDNQSGIRHRLEVLVASVSVPDAFFVFASNGSLKIDAPRLAIRIEIQGAERHLDFSNPSLVVSADTGGPDAIPRTAAIAGITPARAEKVIAHGAGRIDFEEISC